MTALQNKPTISQLVLKPVLLAWVVAAAVAFILGALSVGNEASKFAELEEKKLSLLLAPITRSIEGEILLGKSGVLQTVKTLLQEQHGLEKIDLSESNESLCPKRSRFFASFFYAGNIVCTQGTISTPGVFKLIAISRSVPNIAPAALMKAIAASALPFLALASLVFWIVAHRLRKYLIVPLDDLEQKYLKEVSLFLENEGPARLQIPKQHSRELNHLIEVIEKNASELKASLSEKRDLETKHMQMQAIAGTVQMVSHDVRKPISIAHAIVDMLSGCESLEEVRELLTQTKPELDQAFQSINGTLADLMLAGAEPTLVKEEVQISELLQVAVREILITYPNLRDRLLICCEFDDKWQFDKFKMLRVLGNLLGNACQAIFNREGSITLRAALFDGRLRIEVENTGSFIPPEHIPKLFDQFFTSGKAGGTGLGLAIVKKIVEAHGGNVWCSSTLSAVTFYMEFSRV